MRVALGLQGIRGYSKTDEGEQQAKDGYDNRIGPGEVGLAQKQAHARHGERREEQPNNHPDRDQKRTFHGAPPSTTMYSGWRRLAACADFSRLTRPMADHSKTGASTS